MLRRFLDARRRDRTPVPAGTRLRVKGRGPAPTSCSSVRYKHSPPLPLIDWDNGTACPHQHLRVGSPTSPAGRGAQGRLFVLVLVLRHHRRHLVYRAYWSISTVRASFPQTKGSITLEGLSGPVDVKRDDYGIPQIYASSGEDLFMARGYVQGAGPVLQDGRAPPLTSRHCRRCSARARSTTTSSCARGLAPGAEEYDEKLSDSTKKYLRRTPRASLLPGGQGRRGHLPGVRRPRLHQRLQAAGVDASRLGGLAEGDGLGPAAATCRTRSTGPDDRRLGPKQIADLYPAYHVRPEPGDRPGGASTTS